MKQQDNMTDQPRRYRAQVKRAAKVKRDELPYQEPTAPQKEIPKAEESAAAVTILRLDSFVIRIMLIPVRKSRLTNLKRSLQNLKNY